MLYDCFMFFQEFDLLEIRLHTLAEVVDRFVFVELDRTFSGQSREYRFIEQWDRFFDFPIIYRQFAVPDKILALGNPDKTEAWGRAQIGRLIQDIADEDWVLLSDLDEIPHPDGVRHAHEHKVLGSFVQDLYCFHLNALVEREGSGRPKLISGKWAREGNLHDLRHDRDWRVLDSRGWHFNNVATREEIVVKMQATAHTECGTSEGLAEILAYYDDPLLLSLHGKPMTVVSDSELPPYVQANRERFAHLLL